MVRKVCLALALLGGVNLAEALRLEAEQGGNSLMRPKRDRSATEKTEKKKKRAGLKEKFLKFFEEETTTPKPTYFGLPIYYEGRLPGNFANMSHIERQDFYFRVERWHQQIEEDKQKERCRSPRLGEKVVYFVQHGEPTPKEDDAPLWELGLTQAANIRHDPLFSKGLWGGVKYRPQVVVTSPARKAMQTAVIGFSDLLPEAKWEIDTDIRGMGWVEGSLVPRLGSAALYNLSNIAVFSNSSSKLLSLYRELPEQWDHATKPHKDRWFDFMEHLLARPEERFVVVSHSGMIKQANATKTHPGEVSPCVLLPDKTWRKLSPPDCWPEDA